MFTGLPGTGIGGLFYLVTVVPTMVVIEVVRTLLRRGNRRRALFVLRQALLSAMIVGMYLATGIFLRTIVPSQTVAVLGVSSQTMTTAIIAFPFALLFLVLAGTQLLRFVVMIHERFQRNSSHTR